MRLLNMNDFIKKIINERRDYVNMLDAKFFPYSHYHQVLMTHGLYTVGKSIYVIKAFFLLIAMRNSANFVFQYITESILFQLKYPSACNNIGRSSWTHYFSSAIFNKGIVFAFHSFFLFWQVMFAHHFF